MNVIVSIPTALLQYTRMTSEVHVDAATVGEVVSKLNQQFPGLKALILHENQEVRRYVNIFVNEENIRSRDGLITKLKDGDYVHIIPSIAGGT